MEDVIHGTEFTLVLICLRGACLFKVSRMSQHMFGSVKVSIISHEICDKSKSKSFSEKFFKLRTSFTHVTCFGIMNLRSTDI